MCRAIGHSDLKVIDMEVMTVSGQSAKKQPLKPAYLIVGDDQPKVEMALARLRRRIAEESGTELNIDEFSASSGSAVDVITAANTLAFLSGTRLVLVNGVDSWRKDDKNLIASYLSSPAPDACLALVAEKLPAQDALRTAVAAAGQVLEYSAPKHNQYPHWVAAEAKRTGVSLGLAEARVLVERVGEHQQLLLRELEKLGAYKGKARVTAEDIELLVSRTLEASIFELVDALATGARSPAFSTLEELYASGEQPTGLFYRVLWHFQRLTRVVALREEGLDVAAIQSELKLKPYPAKKMFAQSRAFGPDEVVHIMSLLAETDARLKGKSSLAPELELELCFGWILDEIGGSGSPA